MRTRIRSRSVNHSTTTFGTDIVNYLFVVYLRRFFINYDYIASNDRVNDSEEL
jgi:hypothetical protein